MDKNIVDRMQYLFAAGIKAAETDIHDAEVDIKEKENRMWYAEGKKYAYEVMMEAFQDVKALIESHTRDEKTELINDEDKQS